ncbi:hypothetical protein DF185_19520 [Marinifilum breve]|uniref:PKD domain-containing protein n=1 Tax=Marinifilum breve TaxID=2184082 RepID=A0A2V3ZUX9_9BACT|nr:PKD domain-containing protein [Marinifilum breve]PXX96833.1 hypothetical protein DF185_19520 [Marinifilum breve]
MKKVILILLLFSSILPIFSQNITKYEYWIDDQFDTRISVDEPASATVEISSNINTDNLSEGFHSIHFRFRDDLNRWSVPITEFFRIYPQGTEALVRKIHSFEYWIDDDFSNRQTSAIPISEVANINQVIDTKSLSNGFHSIHFRYKDDSKQWSIPVTTFFRKYNAGSEALVRKVNQFECWVDDDFDNRISSSIPANTSVNIDQVIDTKSLSNGFHSIHFRFKDDTNQWSTPVTSFFRKYNAGSEALVRKINKFEYWIDDDFDNRISSELPLAETAAISQVQNTKELSNGFHSIHFRFRDDSGLWSSPVTSMFRKYGNESELIARKLTAYRYWFNDDISTVEEVNLSEDITPLDLNTVINLNHIPIGDNQLIHFQFKDDSNLWSVVSTDTIERLPHVTSSFTADKTESCGSLTVQFTNNSTDGESYLWEFGDGNTSTEENPNHTYETSGSYTVKLTTTNDTYSKSDVSTMTDFITIHTIPTVDLGTDVQICQGSEHTFSITDNFEQYFWNDASGTNEFTTGVEGNYTLRVVDTNGCEASDMANLSFFTAPSVDLGADVQICEGSSHTFSVTDEFAKYFWNDVEGTNEFTASTEGNITLKVIDANGCEATDIVNLSFFISPAVNLGDDVQICEGNEHTFSVSNEFTQYFWNDVEGTNEFTASTEGNITLKVIDANGCEATDVANLSFHTPPTVDLGADIQICQGNEHTFSVTDEFAQYFWNDVEGSNEFTASTEGNITLKVIDANGCEATDVANLSFHTSPIVDLGSDVQICEGNEHTFSVSDQFTQYFWNDIEGSNEYIADTEGSYTLKVIDANGCEASDQIQLSINNLPVVSLGDDQTACDGEEVILSVEDNHSKYFWNNTEGSSQLTVTVAGDYQLRVVDDNGCEAEDAVTVTFIDVPDINLGDDVDVCEDDSFSFTVSDQYAQYFWNDVEGTNTLDVTTTGVYTLKVVAENGCSSIDEATVTFQELPETPVVTYENGLLSSTYEEEFQWYLNDEILAGKTSQEFTPEQDGNYTVEVWNQYGCKSERSEAVEVILVGIEDLIKENISIYPNPTKGKVVIDLSNNFDYSTNIQLKLFDANGKLIIQQKLNPITTIDLSSYSAGLYFIHFINQGEIVSFKIIKQ